MRFRNVEFEVAQGTIQVEIARPLEVQTWKLLDFLKLNSYFFSLKIFCALYFNLLSGFLYLGLELFLFF